MIVLVVALAALAGVWAVGVRVSGASGPRQQGTPLPEVYAEAVGQANLRGGPGIDYPVVGEIAAGTRYRVLARHSLVPWLRLDVPETGGVEAWVYQELVTVSGSLGAVPVVNDFDPTVTPTALRAANTPAATFTLAAPPAGVSVTLTPSATATVAPSVTPTVGGAIATTLGEANVRFGPDLSYPVIAKVPEGASYRVLELHALVPWVRIALDNSPTGSGWIYQDIVTITGDLTNTPVTTASQFSYPTLTPTPDAVVVSGAPWTGPLAPGRLASTLGKDMLNYLLDQGFAPYSEQMASVFVMDLKSGDTFTLNDGVAYSGMSLTKIPILTAFFQHHSGPLTYNDAYSVAEMMMCSENISSNNVLAMIGDGDALRGASITTAMLQALGLNGSFITRQFVLVPDSTPIPGTGTITTGADQVSAQPDNYNQIEPKDLGFLLASIYQCAATQSGLLIERFPNDFDAQECRKMLYAMDADTINVFVEAGVPVGTRVMHKHGWIGDTHGDAAIVIGPDAPFVFVGVLYARDWLEFDTSAPIIAELARMTWNAIEPSEPSLAVRPGIVPADCDPSTNPVMTALMSSTLPMLGQ